MSTTTDPMATKTPASAADTSAPPPRRPKKKNNGEAGMLAVLGAIVVVGGGAFALISRQNAPPPPPPPPIQLSTAQIMDELVKKARHERGPKNAKITVVEFADVECRFCRQTYNNLLKKFESRGDIRFIFYHYPLPPDTHAFAMPAALALEAADRQKKFWPMYDTLFTGKEPRLRDEELIAAAKEIGLDTPRFQNDVKDPKTMASVEAERAMADRFGVESTPTFFVRHAGSDKVLRVNTEKALRELVDDPKKAGFFSNNEPDRKPMPAPGS